MRNNERTMCKNTIIIYYEIKPTYKKTSIKYFHVFHFRKNIILFMFYLIVYYGLNGCDQI